MKNTPYVLGRTWLSEIVTNENKKLVLASGRAHPQLAEEIAEHLGTELLPLDAYDFANGETYVRPSQSVRGKDVFILQAHPAPRSEERRVGKECGERDWPAEWKNT